MEEQLFKRKNPRNKCSLYRDLKIPIRLHYFDNPVKPIWDKYDSHVKAVNYIERAHQKYKPPIQYATTPGLLTELRHFIMLAWPNCVDEEKIHIVNLYTLFLVSLNEKMRNDSGKLEHFKQFLYNNKLEYMDMDEQIFRNIWLKFSQDLSEYMIPVSIEAALSFVSTPAVEDFAHANYVERKIQINCQEYLKLKHKSFYADHCMVMQDFFGETKLTEKEWNHPLIQKYWQNLCYYSSICNDLHAIKKYDSDRINYVRVVTDNYSCTLQQAIFQILDELKGVELDSFNIVKQLKSDKSLRKLSRYTENCACLFYACMNCIHSNPLFEQ